MAVDHVILDDSPGHREKSAGIRRDPFERDGERLPRGDRCRDVLRRERRVPEHVVAQSAGRRLQSHKQTFYIYISH